MRSAFLKAILLKLAALMLATAIWLPCLHLFFRPTATNYRAKEGVAPKARALAARHLAVWTDPELRKRELKKMQMRNPEWDFMSRTYFVLALANMALRDPQYQPQACEIIDAIVDSTIEIERERGVYHFLLGYATQSGSWQVTPERSHFIDGEIALMLAARRFVEEKPAYRPLLTERVDLMLKRMEQSRVLSAESYPNECWMFCCAVSLAAIRMADVLDGTDHSAFLARWIQTAKARLSEHATGLLISAFDVDGCPSPCGFSPEGSTIWMVCHMLQIVDREFARDQYLRARRELARTVLGFGYSREWPTSCPGSPDVDSGPVVPVLGASASASGLAIMGAAAFDDVEYLTSLLTSLNFLGFPTETDGQRYYQASNPVGDAVLLYGMVLGPLWEEVRRRARA